MKNIKHCKREYKVLTPYSDNGENYGIEVIEVKGKIYKIERVPRPAKNITELFAVFVDGVRYNTFAKFLKSLY